MALHVPTAVLSSICVWQKIYKDHWVACVVVRCSIPKHQITARIFEEIAGILNGTVLVDVTPPTPQQLARAQAQPTLVFENPPGRGTGDRLSCGLGTTLLVAVVHVYSVKHSHIATDVFASMLLLPDCHPAISLRAEPPLPRCWQQLPAERLQTTLSTQHSHCS